MKKATRNKNFSLVSDAVNYIKKYDGEIKNYSLFKNNTNNLNKIKKEINKLEKKLTTNLSKSEQENIFKKIQINKDFLYKTEKEIMKEFKQISDKVIQMDNISEEEKNRISSIKHDYKIDDFLYRNKDINNTQVAEEEIKLMNNSLKKDYDCLGKMSNAVLFLNKYNKVAATALCGTAIVATGPASLPLACAAILGKQGLSNLLVSYTNVKKSREDNKLNSKDLIKEIKPSHKNAGEILSDAVPAIEEAKHIPPLVGVFEEAREFGMEKLTNFISRYCISIKKNK